ncbi:MAG: biopolymer transporter ExbD [Spartobacteria bacterium]|nr:biopolymer transporter ExbD [Spartobacteria bacterium]
MKRHTSLTSLKQISEINLTPLMDLTFILLITFIITFPLIEQGIPVNLPRGEADALEPDQSRTISLDIQGRLFLDDLPISDADLAAEMSMLGKADPDIVILVRADEEIKYKRLVEIMRILHDAKIARMALVTQPDERAKQR